MIQPLKSAKTTWMLYWLDVDEPAPSPSGLFLPTVVFVTDHRGRPLAPPSILEELDQPRVEAMLLRLFDTHGAPDRLLIAQSEDWNEEDWRAFAKEQRLEVRIQPLGNGPGTPSNAEFTFRVAGQPPTSSPTEAAEKLVATAIQLRSPSKKSALLRKALALDPNCSAAHIEAADAEFQRGNWKACQAAYEDIIAREARQWRDKPVDWWADRRTRPYLRALYGRAMTLWHRGRYLEAAAQLEQLTALNPRDHQGARFFIPMLYLLAEDQAGAEAAFDHYEKTYPRDYPEPALLFGWGHCLSVAGRENEARTKYHAAILRNIFIAPLLLEDTLPPQNLFCPNDRCEYAYATGFLDSYALLWDREPGAMRLLREAWEAARPAVAALVAHRQAMLDYQDQRYDPDYKIRWQAMLDEDERLSSAPPPST